MSNALIISDEQFFSKRLKSFLKENRFESEVYDNLPDGLKALSSGQYTLVICGIPILSHRNPSEVLDKLKQTGTGVPIIFITEQVRMSQAIELVKSGLYTCLNKPVHFEEVWSVIEDINQQADSNNQVKTCIESSKPRYEPQALKAEHFVKGSSRAARQLQEQIDIVSNTQLSVIIYGETGTGKESVARRLLTDQSRKDKPFVAIDCGCLSKDLAGSELFGHEKGAFTGALQSRMGAFEMANNGTIFLDEIGNLDLEVQTFLLRAIQERKIRRVGGDKEIDINVRIIVASNEHLYDLVQKGVFREDLYHRLNEFEIVIPALREREEDISLFINFFLRQANEEFGRQALGFTPQAQKMLLEYNWPGNIRELKNIVKRACLMSPDMEWIDIKSLPYALRHNYVECLNAILQDNPEQENAAPSQLKSTAVKAELSQILNVLKKVNYNKTKAAQQLNIDRKTLYNKLKLLKEMAVPHIT